MKSERAIILGAPTEHAFGIYEALTGLCPFLPVARPAGLPAIADLAALFSGDDISLVFLDSAELETAYQYAREVRRLSHHTYIVAYRFHADGEDLLSLLRSGVREWIPTPVRSAAVREVLSRVRHSQHDIPRAARSGRLISFLPAKPGAGCSSAALHFAAEIGHQTNQRPALLDFDLNCGMQSFFLRLHGAHTVSDAASYGGRLDEVTWSKLVSQAPGLDVLPSGTPAPGHRHEPSQFLHVLACAQAQYSTVCVDHSGNWERYSLDTLERSDLIYLVCTADFASLHRARYCLDILKDLDLGSRTRVVLNRAAFLHGVTRKFALDTLGRTPAVEIPNAFGSLQNALGSGSLVKRGCPYHSAIRKLVKSTLGATPGLDAGAPAAHSWLTAALTALRRRAAA